MDTNVTTRPANSGEKAQKTIDKASADEWESWKSEKNEPNNEHRTTSVGINNMGLAFALINN